MNINSELYLQSAINLQLPCEKIKDIDGIKIKLGKHNYYMRGSHISFNNSASVNISNNKYCTNKLLERAGLPVPKAIGITLDEYKINRYNLDTIDLPVVIKPTVGTSLGKGITCNIKDKNILLPISADHLLKE